jgi:hypothetical protein
MMHRSLNGHGKWDCTMKIGNVDRGKGIDRATSKKGVSGGSGSSFADQLRGASHSESAAVSDMGMVDHAALDGVDALLAMQEVGDATDEKARRQASRYGEDLLNRLNVIQDALLMGAIPKDTLMDMAKKLRSGRVKVQDPRLNGILDEIELRVEVEIAKFTRGL